RTQYRGHLSAGGRVHRPYPQGRQARRLARRAVRQVRACHQRANRADARRRHSGDPARARRRGDRVKLPRRKFLHLATGAAALLALSCSAWAQAYPEKPVSLIVTFPAGSGPDIIGRLAGQWLLERLGQQFVIENKPGFGGNIGTEYVVNSAADGYTIVMPGSTNAVNATLYQNLSFNFMRDIAPIAGIGKTPFVVVVPPSFPAKTLPEFIAYAKANPGKINMASGGIGSSPHVCGELLQIVTGIKLVHVPYRSNYMPDLLAGQVQVVFNPIAQ